MLPRNGAEPGAPRWPAIETLLARGRRHRLPAAGTPGAVEWLSGGELVIDRGWPAAPVSRLGEGLAADEGWWLRADPVRLLPFGDRLALLPAGALDAPQREQLVGALNAHFEGEGFRLEAPHAQRWYLRAPEPLHIESREPKDVAGHDIYESLPTGPDAALARRLMTEAQMIFHAAADEPDASPVNGLWLWGGGALPEARRAALPPLWTDEPFERGVWRLTGNRVQELPATAAECIARHEPDGMAAFGADAADNGARTALERDWCAPLLEMLKAGELSAIDLLPGGAERFELTRAGTRRFWRRRRALPGGRD